MHEALSHYRIGRSWPGRSAPGQGEGHLWFYLITWQWRSRSFLSCFTHYHSECLQTLNLRNVQTFYFTKKCISLPPANEVWGKVISLQPSVCPRGGGFAWPVPRGVPGQIPPRTRPSRDQTPPGPDPPLGRHPAPNFFFFWHTLNARAVRILLECILVRFVFPVVNCIPYEPHEYAFLLKFWLQGRARLIQNHSSARISFELYKNSIKSSELLLN